MSCILWIIFRSAADITYYFAYKTFKSVFSSKTIPKNLDLSYKTDLDL